MGSLEELLADEPARLTTADVARLRGWDRVRAWRWMTSLHEKAGEKIVQKRGRRYVIAKQDYMRAIAEEIGRIDPRIVGRLSELEARVIEVEQRVDVHAAAMAKLHMI